MIKRHLMALVDILWPKSCHVCSKIIKKQVSAFDEYICEDCCEKMKKIPPVTCQLCAANLTTDDENAHLSCRRCRQDPPAYQKLMVCYQYEGPVKKLIHSFKYERRPYLAKSIARLMRERLSAYKYNGTFMETIDYLTATPLHPARLREREFNQAYLIAEELSKNFQKPFLQTLKKIKHTKSQTTLKKADRLRNLKGAFALNKNVCVKNKNILIIDDVVTTTATARETALLLKQAGAQNVSILAFAKGLNDENTA